MDLFAIDIHASVDPPRYYAEASERAAWSGVRSVECSYSLRETSLEKLGRLTPDPMRGKQELLDRRSESHPIASLMVASGKNRVSGCSSKGMNPYLR